MNNLEMEAFLKIIECGSFSEAARQLFISQSTLSTRIARLENELGKKIFERHSGIKQIKLTEAGADLAFASKNWTAFIDDVNKIKRSGVGKLSLAFGSVDTFNAYLFLPLFQELQTLKPEIILDIRTHNSTELYQEIIKGRLDVAFTLINIPMEGVVINEVYREPRVALVNGSIATESSTINPRTLDKQKEIFFIGDTAYNNWYKNYNNQTYPLLQVDTVQLLKHFLKKNARWSLVPYCIAREFSKAFNYNFYHLGEEVPPRICYRIQRQNISYKTQAALRYFDDCLEKVRDEIFGGVT